MSRLFRSTIPLDWGTPGWLLSSGRRIRSARANLPRVVSLQKLKMPNAAEMDGGRHDAVCGLIRHWVSNHARPHVFDRQRNDITGDLILTKSSGATK